MIKISYAQARSIAQNRDLLMKLYQTQMPAKTAKKMKRIMERIGLAAKYVDEQQYNLQMQAAKQFAVLDDKGEPKLDEKGELQFETDDKRGEANKYVMVGIGPVLKRELTLVLDPLNLDDTNLQLTLAEVDALGPLMAQEEEDEAIATNLDADEKEPA